VGAQSALNTGTIHLSQQQFTHPRTIIQPPLCQRDPALMHRRAGNAVRLWRRAGQGLSLASCGYVHELPPPLLRTVCDRRCARSPWCREQATDPRRAAAAERTARYCDGTRATIGPRSKQKPCRERSGSFAAQFASRMEHRERPPCESVGAPRSALHQGWLETNAAREKVVPVQTRNVLGPLAWRYLNRTQEFTLVRELTVKCELGLGR
jgi:hypothetical protein